MEDTDTRSPSRRLHGAVVMELLLALAVEIVRRPKAARTLAREIRAAFLAEGKTPDPDSGDAILVRFCSLIDALIAYGDVVEREG